MNKEWNEIIEKLDRIIELLGEISLQQNSYITYYAASEPIDFSKGPDTLLWPEKCTCGDGTTAVCPVHGITMIGTGELME
jgi:hypothetical protein